jgi:hypothetical protein
MELLRRSINECLLVIRQVFKVDLEDHFIVYVDDCGPTTCHVYVDGKSELTAGTRSKLRETTWSRSRALSGLRRTLDRMVVT